MNHVLIVGMLGLLAAGLLRESYRACRAADILPPSITHWYFTIGPAGLMLAAGVSIVISLAVVALRYRLAAVLVASGSLVVAVAFLAASLLAAIAPLLRAIHDMLPPGQRW